MHPSDSTDNDDDKLWIDDQQRILLYRNTEQLIDAVLLTSIPIFDSTRARNWALDSRKYASVIGNKVDYDLDTIQDQIRTINYEQLIGVGPEEASSFINFINLFGDYANQIGDDQLLSIWDNTSLKIFWEYMYNVYFWTIPSEELQHRQKDLLNQYNGDECKESLNNMMRMFKSKFLIVVPEL